MRFPEFSGEWKRVKVSDLLDFYSTNSLAWEALNYESGEINNLHYGLIHKGLPTLIDTKEDHLPFINKANTPRKYTLCECGDIAFADASEDTNEVGKAVEFTQIGNDKVVCGLHTIHGRDKCGCTVTGFKGYAFNSMAFHHQMRRIAQGTKIYSINTRNFEETYIGVPSKEEQSKVAKLLFLIDKRIATQIGLIDKLKSLISGIVVSHYKQSKLCAPINIAELGKPFSTMNLSKEQLSDTGRKCIIYGELFTLYGCVIDNVQSHTEVSKGLTLSSGRDLLFPASTTVDAVSLIAPSALLENDVILGGDMFGITVFSDYSVEYLSYFFNYVAKHQLAKYAQGSTIIHLHYSDIANAKICLPTFIEQEKTVGLIRKMQIKLDLENKILTNLQYLKAYLLRMMFV